MTAVAILSNYCNMPDNFQPNSSNDNLQILYKNVKIKFL